MVIPNAFSMAAVAVLVARSWSGPCGEKIVRVLPVMSPGSLAAVPLPVQAARATVADARSAAVATDRAVRLIVHASQGAVQQGAPSGVSDRTRKLTVVSTLLCAA